MAKWLILHLNHGKVGERQLVSDAQMTRIHAQHITIDELQPFAEIMLNSYGLGLRISAYRGYQLLQHGGGIDGFISATAFLPAEGIAVVVLTNQGTRNMAPVVVVRDILDRLLGLAPLPWSQRMQEEVTRLHETMEAAKPQIKRITEAGPSHDLGAYTGQYEHPGYGRMTVRREGEGLRLRLNGIDELLIHRHFDVFDLAYPPLQLAFPVTFLTGPAGNVDGVSAPIQEGVPAVVFARVAAEEMRHTAFLERFAGAYDLMGLQLVIAVRGDALMVKAPGEPEFELVPHEGSTFTSKPEPTVSYRFDIQESGAVTGVSLTRRFPTGEVQVSAARRHAETGDSA
jgi:hypothetical protein